MKAPSRPLAALGVLLAGLGLRAASPDEAPALPRPARTARFAAEEPGEPRAPQRVNLNDASLAELEALPRIGPALARRIVARRPFARVDELTNVRGIGPATLAALRELVEVSDAPSSLSRRLGGRTEPAAP